MASINFEGASTVPVAGPVNRFGRAFERLDVSPRAFGAEVGQAEQQIGQELHRTAQLYGEIAAQQAANNYQDRSAEIIGDFTQTRGQAAMEAYPEVQRRLRQLRDDGAAGLGLATSQATYNNEVRRTSYWQELAIGRHYNTESRAWAGDVDKATIANLRASVLANPNDEGLFTDALGKYNQVMTRMRQRNGDLPMSAADMTGDHAQIMSRDQREAYATLRAEQIEALLPSDPGRAQQLLDQSAGALRGPLYDSLASKLRGRMVNANADQAVARAEGRPARIGVGAGGGDHVENWETRHFNFGGIRKPGIVAGPEAGGFEAYESAEEGVGAVKNLLTAYQDQHGLNTVRGIVSRWAPPSENDTPALIARASQVTGFGPDQAIDLHDPGTMGKMIEATIRNEQGGKLPVDPALIREVAGTAIPPQAQPATPPGIPAPGIADLARAQSENAMRLAQTLANLADDRTLDEQTVAAAERKARAKYAIRETALNGQMKAVTEARNAALDEYVKELRPDRPIAPDLYDRVTADAQLDATSRENLYRLIETHAKGTVAGDSEKFGPDFYNVRDRVYAADGEPNKIRDPAELVALAVPGADGKQRLTLAGSEKLIAELRQRTPDRTAFEEHRKEFVKGITPLVDKSNPLMGKIDESGPANLYRLQWDLDQKIAAYRQAGKDPTDLLNPGKAEYFGNPANLLQYQKSLQQSLRDKVQTMTGAPASVAAAPNSTIVPPRRPGETPQDYLARLGLAAPAAAAAGPLAPLAR